MTSRREERNALNSADPDTAAMLRICPLRLVPDEVMPRHASEVGAHNQPALRATIQIASELPAIISSDIG
jgi:hypothetical protein